MTKSLIAIALTLLTNILCAEIVKETYDSGQLVGVDAAGNTVDGSTHITHMGEGPTPPACRWSELMVDGKVIARHEENCQPSTATREAEVWELSNHCGNRDYRT